jgi:hypothetical protein
MAAGKIINPCFADVKTAREPFLMEKKQPMPLKPGPRNAAVIFFLIVLITGYAGATETALSPKARVEHPTFAFSPVVEGSEVTHSFTIANQGDGPLNIPGVHVG